MTGRRLSVRFSQFALDLFGMTVDIDNGAEREISFFPEIAKNECWAAQGAGVPDQCAKASSPLIPIMPIITA